jgi:predicted nucleotidyltransferase component of viral defense system
MLKVIILKRLKVKDLKNLNCLLPKTKELLLDIVERCSFLSKYTLVGGSALTLHLCHRKSEDLDFFTYSDNFDKKEILGFIKLYENVEILNNGDTQIDLLINNVKVTFFGANWKFLKPLKIEKFNLASIEAICAMKINVLFLRAKYRDYYDLYFIAKNGMGLKEMFSYSLNVVDGITYKLFVVSLLYIEDIEDDYIDYLEPIENISKEKIRDFFEKRL